MAALAVVILLGLVLAVLLWPEGGFGDKYHINLGGLAIVVTFIWVVIIFPTLVLTALY
jgi:hypothetical protein